MTLLAGWQFGGLHLLSAEGTELPVQHYLNNIKPVLAERCYACHGALKQKAGLRLDTADFLRAGADSDPVISRVNPAESEIIHRLRSTDPDDRMPPEGERVEPEFIEELIAWIRSGAPGPAGESPEEDPSAHWAFLKPVRPAMPAADVPGGSSNPVDRLLAQAHKDAGVVPAGMADERLLVRRAYLDLIGLPPLDDDYRRYFENPESDRWERLVDELLASPHYGERWGRHWMDIWRYTDWFGLGDQLRYSQKHIWHWRDWIIENLNADTGYDDMLMDMLAADERKPADLQAQRATGFLARNYYLFNRTTWLDKTIEHVGKGFLGLTLNCAKCHDHKYDPVSQRDYYQFRAIFEPHQVRLDPVPGATSVDADGIPRAFDAHPDELTWLHIRGDEKQPDKSSPVPPGLPGVISTGPFSPTHIRLPLEAWFPGMREYVLHDRLREADERIDRASSQLADLKTDGLPPELSALTESEAELAVRAATAERTFRELSWKADRLRHIDPGAASLPESITRAAAAWKEREFTAASHAAAEARLAHARLIADSTDNEDMDKEKEIKQASDRLAKTEKALQDLENREWNNDFPTHRPSLKALESPAETDQSRRQPFARTSTGRRLALAGWVTSRDNPLTARVAVNHIWMRHFGEPLVESVADFGRRQKAPHLQSLLDFLAVEFMDHGWSMKHLHRLMVTSDAWKRTGLIPAGHPSIAADPDNRLFWKRSPVRMESQVIRDSVIHLAGELDPTLGGPSVKADKDTPPYRRSLYFLHSRDDQNSFLVQFDDADIEACYRRDESIIPQQALAMANSSLTLTMAEKVAGNLNATAPDSSDEQWIIIAFHSLLGRPPLPEESTECHNLLQQLEPDRNRTILIHALLNHNDFITIR